MHYVTLEHCANFAKCAFYARIRTFSIRRFNDLLSCFVRLSVWKAMRAEKRWHILLSMILLLITSSQCMDSKEVKESERKTLLNLILQVIGEKPASRRVTSGLYSVSQDVKFSSRENSAHLPKPDNSRPIGKLI